MDLEQVVSGVDSSGGEFLQLLRQKALSDVQSVTVIKTPLLKNNCNRQSCAE